MGGVLIIIIGAIQVMAGIAAYAKAASTIQQILGATSFGMGTICIAMGVALIHLTAIRRSSERQAEIFEKLGQPKSASPLTATRSGWTRWIKRQGE
jgi:hypothetical protein